MNEKERVFQLLRKLSGVEPTDEKDTLLGNLGLDSLNMITMLLDIETEFEIRLHESDMNPYDLIWVSDVINLVEKYVGGRNEK